MLQNLRHNLAKEKINNIVDSDKQSEFYQQHLAATHAFYTGNKKVQIECALPPSLASSDGQYQSYALQGQEQRIIDLFKQAYTPQLIVARTQDVIADVYNTEILTADFTTWIREQEFDDELLLDENSQYHPWCITYFLEKMGVLERSNLI
jgi:hypothetical protein